MGQRFEDIRPTLPGPSLGEYFDQKEDFIDQIAKQIKWIALFVILGIPLFILVSRWFGWLMINQLISTDNFVIFVMYFSVGIFIMGLVVTRRYFLRAYRWKKEWAQNFNKGVDPYPYLSSYELVFNRRGDQVYIGQSRRQNKSNWWIIVLMAIIFALVVWLAQGCTQIEEPTLFQVEEVYYQLRDIDFDGTINISHSILAKTGGNSIYLKSETRENDCGGPPEVFCSEVPIILVDFYALFEKNRVKIYWSVAQQITTTEIQLWASLDLENWTQIYSVEGDGNSTEFKDWVYYDNLDWVEL